MPFPSHWPIFTPKDKLAEWFESYARLLELNVWTSTTITGADWDEGKRQWTVHLERKTASGEIEKRTLHPRHIVQATGHSGEMKFPQIRGMDSFAGETLCHSSQFKGAKKLHSGEKKHAIVVGCCNSGHDIAQDFYEHGYDVTIVQRSSTYVMSSKEGLDVLLHGLYEEGGPDTEDADLMFMSIPNKMLKRMHVDATAEISRRDKDLLAGLEKAGFKLDQGPDDAGKPKNLLGTSSSEGICPCNRRADTDLFRRLLHEILPTRWRLLHRRRLLTAHHRREDQNQARPRN